MIQSSQIGNAWMPKLYDPKPEVRELAVRFLEEACESMDVLQMVVKMQPTLDYLGEIWHPK